MKGQIAGHCQGEVVQERTIDIRKPGEPVGIQDDVDHRAACLLRAKVDDQIRALPHIC